MLEQTGAFEREVLKEAYSYAHKKLCDRVNTNRLTATPDIRRIVDDLREAAMTGDYRNRETRCAELEKALRKCLTLLAAHRIVTSPDGLGYVTVRLTGLHDCLDAARELLPDA